MISATQMPLPTSPDALRDLVLKLQKKEAEFTFRISEQEQVITLRDETIARLENTLAKLQRWRYDRRSEQLSQDQISLWQEALDTEIAVIET